MKINTANGTVDSNDLGRTLMHEHLVIGLPGWDSDGAAPAPAFRDMVAACVDRIEELRDGGFSTIVDPCPNDLGRNADLMGEVAARTGFNVIFATGLYNEHMGGSPYWNVVFQTESEPVERLRDLFISEIENGVRGSGIKPGILKVGTAFPPFSDYEKKVFRAAAMASVATSTPVTTHTEGVLGEEQIAALAAEGVAPSRMVIGHSCGSKDHDYHRRIVDTGAYIGFDRFGVATPYVDEDRIESILKLREAGAFDRVIVSHDSTCCWLGRMFPKEMADYLETANHPLRFTRVIAPMLEQAGVTAAEIESLLIDNPRRYFSG